MVGWRNDGPKVHSPLVRPSFSLSLASLTGPGRGERNAKKGRGGEQGEKEGGRGRARARVSGRMGWARGGGVGVGVRYWGLSKSLIVSLIPVTLQRSAIFDRCSYDCYAARLHAERAHRDIRAAPVLEHVRRIRLAALPPPIAAAPLFRSLSPWICAAHRAYRTEPLRLNSTT